MYMFKEDLTLNNLHWLTCYNTQPNQTKPNTEVKNQTQFHPGFELWSPIPFPITILKA